MTIQVALFLLTISSVFTGLITEAIKKTFGEVQKPTILAAVVSVVVGIAIPVGYFIANGMMFMMEDLVFIVAEVVLTWLCATLGYDKVMEAITQIGGKY